MANAFGETIKRLREERKLKQVDLAEAAGISQVMISHWETGRKQTIDFETLIRLANALGVDALTLVQHLPDDHPARKMAAVEIPIIGVVAAGIGVDEPAEPGARLSVSGMFRGCVSYLVRGDSMTEEKICHGDYLLVRPTAEHEPQPGNVVVAWIADKNVDTGAAVVKRFEKGYLRSNGKGRWSHKLSDRDRIYGVLVGVVRVC